MRKGITAIVVIVCIVVGFAAGWLTTAFLPGLTRVSLVDQIKAREYIIVGTASDWPPFEIFNTTTNQLEGFDIDISELVAEELGVDIEWKDMNFDLLIGSLTGGTIDMIAAAIMITPDRIKTLAHSVPYIRVNEIIIVRGDSPITISDLSNLTAYPDKVGAQSGTTEEEELIAAGVTPVPFVSALAMLEDLNLKGIDVAFIDEPILAQYAHYGFKKIFTVPAQPTALWCKLGEPELIKAIDKAIVVAFKDGTMDDLIAKWFG